MCGRFNYVISQGMVSLFDEFGVQEQGESRYNLAPTENVPIIVQANGGYQLTQARWWLVPSWSDGPSSQFAMFNARSESIDTSRAYKVPFHQQRCLMPATSYIEWKNQGGNKQPYEIFTQPPLLFAGVWDQWQGKVMSCAMLTKAATSELAHIHKRMPVMLTPEQGRVWLDHNTPINDVKALLTHEWASAVHTQMVEPSIGRVQNKIALKVMGSQPNMDLFEG